MTAFQRQTARDRKTDSRQIMLTLYKHVPRMNEIAIILAMFAGHLNFRWPIKHLLLKTGRHAISQSDRQTDRQTDCRAGLTLHNHGGITCISIFDFSIWPMWLYSHFHFHRKSQHLVPIITIETWYCMAALGSCQAMQHTTNWEVGHELHAYAWKNPPWLNTLTPLRPTYNIIVLRSVPKPTNFNHEQYLENSGRIAHDFRVHHHTSHYCTAHANTACWV